MLDNGIRIGDYYDTVPSSFSEHAQCSICFAMSLPTPREIVQMPMREGMLIYCDVKSSKRGHTRKAILHLTLKCARSDSCRNNGAIVFEKGTRFTNSYKHF